MIFSVDCTAKCVWYDVLYMMCLEDHQENQKPGSLSDSRFSSDSRRRRSSDSRKFGEWSRIFKL
jgi:hypothetical protein